MTDLVTKVDKLAGVIRKDQNRQDAFLAKLAPANAESLSGKTLSMSGTSKKAGYLASNPAAAYKSGQGAGASVSYLINDPSFTLSTPNTSTAVNDGDLGQLVVKINDVIVDNFDLESVFDASKEDGAQTYTPENSGAGKITVTSVEVYESIWQKLNARVNITAADLRKGYNKIVLEHTGTREGDQVSAVYEVFYDDAPTNPLMSAVSLAIHQETPRYLSGVCFLAHASKVKTSTVVAALIDNSYVGNAIQFYGLKGAPTITMGVTDGSVSGISTPPVVGETATITDKVITLSVANQCSANGRLTGRPSDPFGSYDTVTSPVQNLLVSTFGNTSTNTKENFDDENYRLPLSWDANDKVSPVTGNWDSTAALGSSDAQQFISADNEHALMYPAIDFSNGYQPANSVDYSAHNGDHQYLRAIVTSSAKSSIQLQLAGVTGGIGQVGSGDLNVELKMPGETGWVDCAKAYNGTSVANDGEGCLVGSIGYSGGKATINATFGTKSSFGANNRCYLRITLRNGNRFVKSVITNW